VDYFNLLITALVGVIVWTIIRAVRMTKAEIDGRLRGTDPRQRTDFMLKLATEARASADRVRCPECDGPTFILLGTHHRYECQRCHAEFEGPEHLPALAGTVDSGHPMGL